MMLAACRSCGAAAPQRAVSLGPQPLANALLDDPAMVASELRVPLELAMCGRCGLVQLTQSVDPSVLFTDYPYFSSYSPALVASAGQLCEQLVQRHALDGSSLAMEVGSNDGYLLQHYAAAGVPVLGVDPAANIAAVAIDRGVPTVVDFFGVGAAESLRQQGRAASVLHANNVIAHVPDINDFVGGIARILAPQGVAVIETPYVRALVEGLQLDTIYHEHVFYYSATSLHHLLARHGLEIVDVEHIDVHGGSLRVTAGRAGEHRPTPPVAALLRQEGDLGVARPSYLTDLSQRMERLRDQLLELLGDLRRQGQRVAGYGAAAKATVLLNYLGVGPDVVEFVADRSPHKQGRYVPGVAIPIVAAEELERRQPDVTVLFAWNFAAEIMGEQEGYRRAGGRFLVPLPTPTLVEADAPARSG